MQNHPDQIIKPAVPFLGKTTVVFYKGDDDVVNGVVERNRVTYESVFDDAGYSFLFLPDLAKRLSRPLMQYFFPGQKPAMVDSMYGQVRHLAHLGKEAGFIYQQDGITFFHCLSDSTEETVTASVHQLATELAQPQSSGILFSVRNLEDYDAVALEEFSLEPEIDARTQEIINAWEEIELKYGITIDELAAIINCPQTLSRLTISKAGKIVLADWDGSPEVKMDDLTKSVYLFYLRHPEGCRLKELQAHKDEILLIYNGISGRDDPSGIRKSIRQLLNPFENNLNVSFSRIKKAFKDIVGDNIAKYYYVNGRYGEVRSVRIDRDLVIWEN